jgi:hypothetical protein
MKYLIIPLMLLSSHALATKYSVGYGYQNVRHTWGHIARFDTQIHSLSLSAFNDAGFGVRAAYGIGNSAKDSFGSAWAVRTDKVLELEILYKYDVNDWSAFWGVGYYEYKGWLTGSNYSGLDHDFDLGPTVGVKYNLDNQWSVSLKATRYYEKDKPAATVKTYGVGLFVEYAF